jgi:integrase
MHILRHTTAVNLLHAGVDIAVIALWLGHEQTSKNRRLPSRRHDDKESSIGKDEATR